MQYICCSLYIILVAYGCPCSTQVYRVNWWMGHYGHMSPKRHKAFTNNKSAGRYNMGKLNLKKFRQSQDPSVEKPTVQYMDSHGRKRYAGTKTLKLTQWLVVIEHDHYRSRPL